MPNSVATRQATRSTFAFAPAQRVETRNTLDPGFRGGSVQGGESTGGVVRATPFTLPTDDGIPDFLLKSVEPYIKEKQAEAAFRGATDAAAGKALTDVAKGDSGISRIFGPSYYHQGAAAFTATANLEKLQAEIKADPEVERLGPAEINKYLVAKYKGLMTGDPVADQLLQHSVMQMHGPLVQTLTARNAAYVQGQAILGWSNTADSKADNLQTTMTDPSLDSPSGTEARVTSLRDYVGHVLNRPAGMDVETHQKVVVNSARAALAKGNFFAFEALKSKGLDSVMGDEQAARMETAYQQFSSRAFGLVTADPSINKALATLDMQIKVGAFKSPAELVKPIEAINAQAQRLTGITGRQLISGDDLLSMQKALNEGQYQAGLRLQSHQWELDREKRDHDWDIQKKQLEDAENLRIAQTYASVGNVSGGLAVGAVDEKDANRIFGEAALSGNVGLLAGNFQSGGYVNKFAASQLQGPIANSLGHGLTKGFEAAYKQWAKLNAANPAAAAAYYGEHAANIEGYNRLIQGGEQPLSAYAQTFGKGPVPGGISLPEGVKRSDAVTAVRSAISADDRRYLGFAGQRTPLSESAQSLVENWLLPRAGTYARDSGISIDQAAHKLYAVALANGEIERAGPLAWTNAQGAKKISQSLGLPDSATDQLITRYIGERLTMAGFTKGLGAADYRVLRVDGHDGKPALYVQAMNDDYSGHTDVLVTVDELRAANRKEVQTVQEHAARKYQEEHTPFKVDTSAEAIAARRDSYRHAMDIKPGDSTIDLIDVARKAVKPLVIPALNALEVASNPTETVTQRAKRAVKDLQDYSYRHNHVKRPKAKGKANPR